MIVILTVGIHVEGEYNKGGGVEWGCENVGVVLDSPALREMLRYRSLRRGLAVHGLDCWKLKSNSNMYFAIFFS